jgi:hypothetical protein
VAFDQPHTLNIVQCTDSLGHASALISTAKVGLLNLLEPTMTRTLAAVLALMLVLPSLAFAAAVSAAGANPSLISSGVTFFVVLGAVIAMVIEIKRLADQNEVAH